MTKLSELFDVRYGVNLELNRLEIDPKGTNFVSRTFKNNGVSARVAIVDGVDPIPAGMISVAGGGSVMASFLQPEPFYSGRDLYYLRPLQEMTDQQKLYYCCCLSANRYRFNYGRQANRTLRDLEVPSPREIPKWVSSFDSTILEDAGSPALEIRVPDLETHRWRYFEFQQLFDLKKGKRLTKAQMAPGPTPFIGAIDSNNGSTNLISEPPIHDGNTITVNYNGSVAEAYYQPIPFWATDDINVLYPKLIINQFIAMFICTVIRHEKYRFNYGRKWHLERMKTSEIKLPAKKDGAPDFEFMERFIKSLPFTKEI